MHDNVELQSMDDMEDKGGNGEGKDDLQEANNMQIDQGGQGQHEGDNSGIQNHLKGNCEELSKYYFSFNRQSWPNQRLLS
jgi:hypothetical protein